MSRRAILGTLCAVAALGAAAPAVARGQVVADSIEWVAEDCEAIVLGRFLEPGAVGQPQAWSDRRLWFQVEEVLKGPRFPQLISLTDDQVMRNWQTFRQPAAEGRTCLLFITAVPRDPPHSVAWLRHQFELRPGVGLLALGIPPRGDAGATDDLDKLLPVCALMDLRLITGVEPVLQAVRTAAAQVARRGMPGRYCSGCRPARTRAAHTSMAVPPTRPTCVSPGTRLEQLALRWAREGADTARALEVLRYYDSPRANEALRRLLRDATREIRGDGKAAIWRFPLRGEAYEVLLGRGAEVPRPLVNLPHDARQPLITARVGAVAAFGLSAIVSASMLWTLVSRRRRAARGGKTGVLRWGWRWLITLLLLTAAGMLLLSHRSHRHVHEVAFSTQSARHWVSAFRGGLQIVSLRYWPEAQPASYAMFDLQSSPTFPWEDGGVVVTKQVGRGSFRYVEGTLAARPVLPPSRYQSFHAPLWAAALVVGLVPLIVAARWVAGSLRIRRWRRQGRCPGCGYDLRGNACPERCPECGRWLGRVLPRMAAC